MSSPDEAEQLTKLRAALEWIAGQKRDNLASEVRPGLFLGSVHCLKNIEFLERIQLARILSIVHSTPRLPDSYSENPGFQQILVPIHDHPEEDLLAILPRCFSVIEEGLRGRNDGDDKGGVLVHCVAGKSRSPAVVAAYLMTVEKLSLAEAMGVVKAARPVVNVNQGFLRQLRQYERNLKAARGAEEGAE